MTIRTSIAICCISLMACSTTSKTSIDDILSTQLAIMPADSMLQKQKKGIDLFAKGNDPVDWNLSIDFDKQVAFTSVDGKHLEVLPSFEQKEIISGIEHYRLRTDLGPMTIQVFSYACTAAGAGEKFTKKVEVKLQGKHYTGCGQYLFDHRLNDIWVLERIDNDIQVKANFTDGLPQMELNLSSNKMQGSDGCNKISSGIEVKGNRIRFSPFLGTGKFCNDNKAQRIFSTMLSDKPVDYYLEAGKLVFYLIDDSKLYFKRKDL